MRDSITGYSIFNENKLARQLDNRSVLLVESDADISIIGTHVNEESVRCKPGFARTATLLAAQLHLNYGDSWVSAIVDRDVIHSAVPSNAFTTRFYDLEAEIFLTNSESVARLAYRYLVTEATASYALLSEARKAVASAIELAKAIGWVRYSNHRQGLGISTAGLPLAEVMKRSRAGKTLIEAVSEMACLRARKPSLSTTLSADATRAASDASILIDVCNGHDLLNCLRFNISSQAGKSIGERDFARAFHGLANCPEFSKTSVFEPIQSWIRRESGNLAFDCNSETTVVG